MARGLADIISFCRSFSNNRMFLRNYLLSHLQFIWQYTTFSPIKIELVDKKVRRQKRVPEPISSIIAARNDIISDTCSQIGKGIVGSE